MKTLFKVLLATSVFSVAAINSANAKMMNDCHNKAGTDCPQIEKMKESNMMKSEPMKKDDMMKSEKMKKDDMMKSDKTKKM
ncbi:MAG: hypothetical protein SOW21_03370 [[Actinobacillus] rossii]|nr:hypothetical protein [[Actinobacillus] rossii]MDY3123412.1 hypothetical protein [[Actinobacillus] rossii]MDY4506428.1 hypothetical protein [[Actinobacillus] rossii]